MNEIERAIIIIEDGVWWEYIPDDLPDKASYDLHYSLDVALTALCEKLEQSKGCGYCNDLMMNPKSGLYKALYGYPKRFCLNCGRKLDGGGEG